MTVACCFTIRLLPSLMVNFILPVSSRLSAVSPLTNSSGSTPTPTSACRCLSSKLSAITAFTPWHITTVKPVTMSSSRASSTTSRNNNRSDRYRSGTATCGVCGRSFIFNHQVPALHCVKWHHGCHRESDAKSKICQTMQIYLKNIPAKFHPDPILNQGALGFFEYVAYQWGTRWLEIGDQFLI